MELSEVSAPGEGQGTSSALTTAAVLRGPALTPEQHIYFYDDVAWEEFVREWVTAVRASYDQVKRMGGANDKGVDVAGFVTAAGFDSAWDCFQCKHYGRKLQPADLWPEVLKVIRGVRAAAYTWPRRYRILSPRGCGSKLEKLLSSPTALSNAFLEAINGDNEMSRSISNEERAVLHGEVAALPFSIFDSEQLSDVLEVHRGTPYFVQRFGGPLPVRPMVDDPPADIGGHESRYVEQLLDAYQEAYGVSLAPTEALGHERTGDHFRRQRETFYSAEALRLFARDSVPKGTFEALQEDVFEGVVEQYEGEYLSGLERLRIVLIAAAAMTASPNALMTVSGAKDYKGICHQLANVDRFVWRR